MSNIKSSVGAYLCGNCDIMALALHRLTGKPMGLWVSEVVLLPASEFDIRDAFTACMIEEDEIRSAIDFALSHPSLVAALGEVGRIMNKDMREDSGITPISC